MSVTVSSRRWNNHNAFFLYVKVAVHGFQSNCQFVEDAGSIAHNFLASFIDTFLPSVLIISMISVHPVVFCFSWYFVLKFPVEYLPLNILLWFTDLLILFNIYLILSQCTLCVPLWKRQKTLRFSDVFRGKRNGAKWNINYLHDKWSRFYFWVRAETIDE